MLPSGIVPPPLAGFFAAIVAWWPFGAPAATPNAPRLSVSAPPFPHFVAFASAPGRRCLICGHVPSRCKARASLYLVQGRQEPQHESQRRDKMNTYKFAEYPSNSSVARE